MQGSRFATLVHQLEQAAAELAGADLAEVPAALLMEAVPALHRAAVLAETAAAVALRRVEVSGEWATAGARSAAAWASAVTGSGLPRAHDRLAAVRLVEQYPAFADGFRSGATSSAHLLVVHRALSGDGSVKARRRREFGAVAEAFAGAAAQVAPGSLRRGVEMWCAAVDHSPQREELDVWAARYLVITECLGECLIDGRLPLAEGRLLKRRLEAVLDAHHRHPDAGLLDRGPFTLDERDDAGGDQHHRAVDPAGRTPRAALMADALCYLGEIAAASPGSMPLVDGTPPHLLVVVPAERLGAAVPPPPAQLWAPGTPAAMSDAAAQRLACGDTEVRRLVLDAEGIATELGRSSRSIPRPLRLAVGLRDGRCRYPGCTVPAFLAQIHHVRHWAQGGCTDRCNLAALCGHHHRFVHEAGVTITGDADGVLRFERDGALIGTSRPQPLVGAAGAWVPGWAAPKGAGPRAAAPRGAAPRGAELDGEASTAASEAGSESDPPASPSSGGGRSRDGPSA